MNRSGRNVFGRILFQFIFITEDTLLECETWIQTYYRNNKPYHFFAHGHLYLALSRLHVKQDDIFKLMFASRQNIMLDDRGVFAFCMSLTARKIIIPPTGTSTSPSPGMKMVVSVHIPIIADKNTWCHVLWHSASRCQHNSKPRFVW